MSEAEDLLGSALGQDVRVRRAGDGVKAELRFDELRAQSRSPAGSASGAESRARIAAPGD